MQYSLAEIQDAILALLEPLRDSYLNTIAPYTGDLEQDLQQIVVRFPAAFVAYENSTFEDRGRRQAEVQEWLVLLCDRGFRLEDAERNQGQGPGTLALLDQAKAALFGKTPLQDMTPILVTSQQPVAYDRNAGISIYSMYISTNQFHLI